VAFIEAFRRRGIYPRDLRTLSEDSLRWQTPTEDPTLEPGQMDDMLKTFIHAIGLRGQVDRLRYKRTRLDIWNETRHIRADLHDAIQQAVENAALLQRLTGLALSTYEVPKGVLVHRDGQPVFTVKAFREARREGGDGRVLNQVFVTLLQKETMEHDGQMHTIRCGSTLVIDLDETRITYVIRKGLHDLERLERTIAFQEGSAQEALAATYFGEAAEPFAALHRIGT
jgi:hypothetical protein